jgi:exodeoxyribonuclease VII large subunit
MFIAGSLYLVENTMPRTRTIRYISPMDTIDISQTEEIFTVSRLNRDVRFILEGSFPSLWVEGEISNFAAPGSGHWYFSLKDATAQVRCAMFKPHQRKLGFVPKDGMQVMLRARVSLYEGRGEFQLIAENMEEMGEGQLRKAFEALKKRLQAAGLFDPEHKKALPALPTSIGIITSPTGAAVRDILSVLSRRFPCVPVVIYPTLVQGDGAAPQIVNAIKTANRRKECDVLILSRGGGSLEDLWPFNEESVAQAIFQSQLPIISGVGHEIDFTIADFVADVRAPTPSAAAELVTPDQDEMLATLSAYEQRLMRRLQDKLQQLQQLLAWTNKHLQQQHPRRRLLEQRQNLDVAEMTLMQLQTVLITRQRAALTTLHARLQGQTPTHAIREHRDQLTLLRQQLGNAVRHEIQQKQLDIGNVAATLDALSPLATLNRGYAIATQNQRVLRQANEVRVGESIRVRLSAGSLECTVDRLDNSG